MKEKGKYSPKIVLVILIFLSFRWGLFYFILELVLAVYRLVKFLFVLVFNLTRKMAYIPTQK